MGRPLQHYLLRSLNYVNAFGNAARDETFMTCLIIFFLACYEYFYDILYIS